MTIDVFGVGVGRTGTYSLKRALNQLGLGPCHHMEEVFQDMAVQVPTWSAAARDSADWRSIYAGYRSAVDWPTASFFRELAREFPSARFILTERDPEVWVDSFCATIYKGLACKGMAPPDMHGWLDMTNEVIAKSGFPAGLERDELVSAFEAHNESVKDTIPADRLLEYSITDSWGPLCEFLGVPVPDRPFPFTNDREEFWIRVL